MTLLEGLRGHGVDVERTLERFMGNESLYMRFLLKFPQDLNFHQAKDALEKRDSEQALRSIHTLKGVAANLGLDSLSDLCAKLVNRLRAGEDSDDAALRERLEAEYNQIVTLIKTAEQ